jgi:hypothetical protein
VRRLAFLSFLAATALVAAPALAEDDAVRIQMAPNPGFAYELAPGSGPGTVVVRIRNASSVPQSIYRAFPAADNRFDVVDLDAERDSDEAHRHPRRLSPPLSSGRITSTGIALEPGQSYDVQVDLRQLFELVPAHRYRVTARALLRFGPADRAVMTKLRSKEITITG